MPAKILKPPFGWFGGKEKNIHVLLPHVPTHDAYLEPFFGAGSLFFAKRPSRIEVINDIDEDLMNFYSVLRDDVKFNKLVKLAHLTLYSRAEYMHAREKFKRKAWKDDVERAYLFYIMVRMSFAGKFGHSWGYNISATSGGIGRQISGYLSSVDRLPEIHERLRHAQIECDDWLSVYERYVPKWLQDGLKVFVYLDPPYLEDVRKSGKYRYELSRRRHEELIEVVKREKGAKIMLSGYPSPLYEELEEAGWCKKCWNVACHAVGRTRAYGLLGRGATFSKNQRRTECIWMNYENASFTLSTLGRSVQTRLSSFHKY